MSETYVLLPGAGGDSWYWHLVAPLLRERGHEVLTPDLPAADDTAGLDAYAQTVVEAIGERDDPVTIVAQSMAAFVAPMVCERVAVAELLLVAPMIPAPGETPGAWWETSGQLVAMRELDEAEGRDPDAPFDPDAVFLHDLPPDVLTALLERGEPEQSGRPMADTWPLTAWPDVPTRVLAGRHDRLFPLAFLTRLAEDRLGVTPDVVDTGHLPALVRPAEVARWLERADRLFGAAPSGQTRGR